MTRLILAITLLLAAYAVPAAALELTDINAARINGTSSAAPVSAPAPESGDKKIKACWIKAVEAATCVYKCTDGEILRQPMQRPSPFEDQSYASCPQLIFPFGKKEAPKAGGKAAPVREQATTGTDEKKLTVCWIKGIKKDLCLYKCTGGRTLEQPMQRPSPFNDGIMPLPCPQLVFPGPLKTMEKREAAAPGKAVSDEGDKKTKACWIKKIQDGNCVYKCNNGQTLEQPIHHPSPADNGGMIPLLCPQLIFPFGK